jgi:hypothetical protein
VTAAARNNAGPRDTPSLANPTFTNNNHNYHDPQQQDKDNGDNEKDNPESCHPRPFVEGSKSDQSLPETAIPSPSPTTTPTTTKTIPTKVQEDASKLVSLPTTKVTMTRTHPNPYHHRQLGNDFNSSMASLDPNLLLATTTYSDDCDCDCDDDDSPTTPTTPLGPPTNNRTTCNIVEFYKEEYGNPMDYNQSIASLDMALLEQADRVFTTTATSQPSWIMPWLFRMQQKSQQERWRQK